MRISINLSINKVVRVLILSDFTILFAVGLFAPIFAIFITKQIQGGGLEVVGLAATTYWVARALTTVPFSRYMDRTDGERDEFYFMFIGSILLSIISLLFIVSSKPWHSYILQAINGFVNSMAVPGWRILFTNHIDKGKVGYEWSVEDVAIGTGTALSAYIGSIIAKNFGFDTLFIVVSIMGLIGSFILLPIYRSTHTLKEMRRIHKERFQSLSDVDNLK